jgi:hypothetical protein
LLLVPWWAGQENAPISGSVWRAGMSNPCDIWGWEEVDYAVVGESLWGERGLPDSLAEVRIAPSGA